MPIMVNFCKNMKNELAVQAFQAHKRPNSPLFFQGSKMGSDLAFVASSYLKTCVNAILPPNFFLNVNISAYRKHCGAQTNFRQFRLEITTKKER